jgi:PEP-CTERM motif
LSDPVSSYKAVGTRVRRRRSWYRRRLRVRRVLVAVVVGVLVAGACWQTVARHFSLPYVHSSQVLPASFWARQVAPEDNHKSFAFADAESLKSPKQLPRIPNTYPYSVVPGGIKSSEDLRYAALRDYVIRHHYAHFNFANAQLVRNTEARAVYLSYRIRDRVFWTRKRIRLHVGELLLTDGNIIARARCGNQTSDVAMPEVSNEEPDEDVLDQPVVAVNTVPSMPIRPMLTPPDLPEGVPIAPQLFAGNFFFPYVPVSVPFPNGACPKTDEIVNGKCVPKKKPPVVPEPPTMLLIGSGLALIAWRYRKITRSTAA